MVKREEMSGNDVRVLMMIMTMWVLIKCLAFVFVDYCVVVGILCAGYGVVLWWGVLGVWGCGGDDAGGKKGLGLVMLNFDCCRCVGIS